MSKEVTVKTSSGTKLYKISESGGKYYCMKYSSGLFGSWNDIGKTRSQDDAISLIRSHASKYGTVYRVSIE